MEARPNRVMGILILVFIIVSLHRGYINAQTGTTTGQELWTYTSTWTGLNDVVHDVAYDHANGKVYIAGQKGGSGGEDRIRYVVACLDANTGTEYWRYEEGGAASYPQNQANAVVVGDDGFIYSAGQINFGGSNWQMRVVKHNPFNGNSVATWLYDYLGYDDALLDLEYGPNDRLYACGYGGFTGGLYDVWTVVSLSNSLNPADTVFKRFKTTLSDSIDSRALVLKIDANDFVWVGGYKSRGYVNVTPDFVVHKLQLNLAPWGMYRRRPFSSSAARCLDLALPQAPGDQGIYAAGYYDSLNQGFNMTVVHIKDNPNHSPYWVFNYDGAVHEDDQAYQVVASPGNLCYAAGYSTSTTGQDYTVVGISNLGSLAWIEQYNGSVDGDDQATSIGINSIGNFVYAAGYSAETDQDDNIIVTKHNSTTGERTWTYMYHHTNGVDRAYAMDVGFDGNIYLGGLMKPQYNTGSFAAMALPQQAPPTVPILISPSDSSFLTQSNITLVWHASEMVEAPLLQYMAERSKDPNFTSANNYYIISPDTTFTTSFAETTWYWRVKTQDVDLNWSKWSETWFFEIDKTNPDVPVLTSPILNTVVFDSSVTFDWDAVTMSMINDLGQNWVPTAAPVMYVLQLDTTNTFTSSLHEDTFSIDQGTIIIPDGWYYWRVMAYDLAGNQSDYSIAASFGLDARPPVIETEQLPDDPSQGPFYVNAQVIDPVLGVDSVYLWYWRTKTDPAFLSDKMTVGADDWYQGTIPMTTHPFDTVWYYVQAWDSLHVSTDPVGAPGAYYSFVAYNLGIQEFDTPGVFSFGLKNNPARDIAMFSVELPEDAYVNLQIFDVSGRLVDNLISGRISAGHYDIPWASKKTAGIYFYSLESPWKTEVGKLVLVR